MLARVLGHATPAARRGAAIASHGLPAAAPRGGAATASIFAAGAAAAATVALMSGRLALLAPLSTSAGADSAHSAGGRATKGDVVQLYHGKDPNPENAESLADFAAVDSEGRVIQLGEYADRVVVVVNVACGCGLTATNYRELTELYEAHKHRGLAILAFPSDSFNQEKGDMAEIVSFVRDNYASSFPLFSKVDVNGQDSHPLFTWLASKQRGLLGVQRIAWNFQKFLVVRGQPVARFAPTTSPAAMMADLEPHLKEWEHSHRAAEREL